MKHKGIHIMSTATMDKHKLHFTTCQYLSLTNDKVIAIGELPSANQAALVADGAIALPHMLSPEPLEGIADALAHLGIKAEHKTFEALMILKRHHPAFNPSAF